MAAAIKTPGVYVQELNAFPNSVVEVPTAVPAFIGYTEKSPTPNVPTRISSLAEYHSLFGGAPKTKFTYVKDQEPTFVANSRFLLYSGMRLFFDNGGGPCWIISIGSYDPAAAKAKDKFTGVLPNLKKIQEPTIMVAPDAVLLDRAGWQEVCQQLLLHCNDMQSRVSILDIFDGATARTNNDTDDVITLFRNAVTDNLNYGQAYYPWVNTSIFDDSDVDFSLVDDASLATLKTDIDADADALVDANLSGDAKKLAEGKRNALKDLNTHLTATPAKDAGAKGATGGAPTPTAAQVHNSLMQVSPRYKKLMGGIRKLLNLQPPSAAMAGVYTRVDNFQGVFKAPANTGIMSVLSPCLEISHEEQEDLNAPLNGKAVNAIRSFVGQGVLIWGARTLDGNSQDWRYINVRRTIIMLEQSIKNAARAYVFQANNSSTWVTMRSMISNFLVNQWKAGALVGATPEEAFSVDVGLGSTMTADDILNGFMRITVKVALVRPAEFIVITFQQKMQTS